MADLPPGEELRAAAMALTTGTPNERIAALLDGIDEIAAWLLRAATDADRNKYETPRRQVDLREALAAARAINSGSDDRG